MERFKNKTAIITGGSGGIGSTTAKMFLKEGGKALLVDIDEEALEKLTKEIDSPDLYTITADVGDETQVKKYAEEAGNQFGHVDFFFNNAGIEGVVKPLDEYPIDIFHKLLDINLKGVYYGLRHVFPLMKNKGGSVVVTSSVAGMIGMANMLPYVASKHAANGMVKVAAQEGAQYNIRVNAINPAPVDNRMMRSVEEGYAPGEGEAARKGFEQIIPMGRYATNEEVADLALFLASDQSSYITGAIHPIDGGMTV